MEKLLYIIFTGFVGALIGWITNVIAIRLLFRPYNPYRVPLIGWVFQGLIPKRKKDIAIALGVVVSGQLITGEDVARSLGRGEIREKIAVKIRTYVRERVLDKLPFLIPQSLQTALAEYAGQTLYQEVINFLENPQVVLQESELEDIKAEIRRIVEDKILSFDMKQLEEITYSLARTELKHIELLGGILGLLIGLLQGCLALNLITY